MLSHNSDGAVLGSGVTSSRSDTVSRLMSLCPHLDVTIGGVSVPCLVDTGSMVSTIIESFFLQHFKSWGHERLQSCNWLQLRAANGLAIPYVGYLELDVILCGKYVPACGVLVVKDPPGNPKVPGVLGMNIICKCYDSLFGQHGSDLIDLPTVFQAPRPIFQALQQCHQSLPLSPKVSKVKLRGGRAARIPGGVMKFVAATYSDQY